MDETPLGVDDGDQIERFDPTTVSAADGGAGLVVTTGERAYTTVESSVIEIDPGEPVDEYTGVAAGQTVATVADETVYRIRGASASHQRPVTGARDVFVGPDDDYLTVLCADGRLVWLGEKLREMGAKRTAVDPTDAVVVSASGWTAISDGETVYCYREPVDERVAIAEIGPSLLDGAVRDLSFVDGLLVIATTAGLVSFDSTGEFERRWTAEHTVTGLSNPADHRFYGWNDELVRITADGRVTSLPSDVRNVVTTADHSQWYADLPDGSVVSERDGTVSVELSVESVGYRDHESVIADVTNPTTEEIDYGVDVTATGLGFQSDGETRVSAPPLSRTTVELGTVSVMNRVESGTVTVTRSLTGERLAERTVPVVYGDPRIRASARLTELTPDGPRHTVTAHNEGNGVAFVDTTTPPEPTTWHRVTPGETVEVTDTTDEELYAIGAGPDASPRSVGIDTDVMPPDSVCSVSCSLGRDEDVLRLAVENHTDATVHDQLTVDVEGGPKLTGGVTVPPETESDVWLGPPESMPPIVRVTVEGSFIEETTEQVSDHRFLGLERRFYDTGGSQTDPTREPAGTRFEERLTVRNDTGGTLSEATVSGYDMYTLPDLPPDEATILTRQVVLPNGEGSAPSVVIGDADDQIELPERDQSQRLRHVRLLAAVRSTDDGFTLLLEVECDDRDQFSEYVLRSLHLDGESLLGDGIDVDQTFEVGETHRRRLPMPLDSTETIRRLESQPPQPVTAVFAKPDGYLQYRRSTLAPVTDAAFVLRVEPRVDTVNSRSLFNDKHRLSLRFSDTRNHKVIVVIRDRDGNAISSCKRPLSSRVTMEFETDESRVRVSVEGTGRSSLNNGYVFRQLGSGWRLEDRSEQTPLPTEPVVTPWERFS